LTSEIKRFINNLNVWCGLSSDVPKRGGEIISGELQDKKEDIKPMTIIVNQYYQYDRKANAHIVPKEARLRLPWSV